MENLQFEFLAYRTINATLRKNNEGMRGRKLHKNYFNPRAIQHIYQRAADRGVIFYTLEDRLVYYTIAAVQSKKHCVRIAAASIMFTHTHQSVLADSLQNLRDYLHGTNTVFSRLYNLRYGRKGRLFGKPPGRAQKNDSKSMRSNIIYVFNNHVEKGLCKRAVQERWSLLSFSITSHPFSHPLDRVNASSILRRALNKIDKRINKNQNLDYRDLDRVLPFLNQIEKEQFIDYVISRYAWVNFSLPTALFGRLEDLITAVDSTTGNEYDINEEHSAISDKYYPRLIRLVENENVLKDIFTMTSETKTEHIVSAHNRTGAPLYILRKFYHYSG